MLTSKIADAANISSQVKAQLPGSGKEAKKEFELNAERAGQSFDKAVSVVPRSRNEAHT
jgi:hypothetical protein